MIMMDSNGVMSMKMQKSVPVPAQQEVIFKPGGLHVMLFNLKQDLKVGDTMTLTLNFKEVGDVVIDVPVREP